ncbi:unnamed protein product [Oppiella nova]|uniref:ABC-2 type transporter transmembrane domain-containing protein n=1 Tax=Oppiella nova TaxID=334625 RepID=A0A7R9M4E5_9ACAR|nr:unnamed protein product [Oppiella nova]CAG2169229.1 unnamed protein product [Oppiella nova]
MVVAQDTINIPGALYNNDTSPKNWPRMFIDSVGKQSIKFREYPDLESAVNSVRNGLNYLALEFRQNFSDAFETRVTDPLSATDEELNQSGIYLYLDYTVFCFTNEHGLMSLKHLITGFNKFLDKLGIELGQPNLYKLNTPIQIIEVLYGHIDKAFITFDLFGTPVLVMMIVLMPMVLSSVVMMTAKSKSTIERVFVAGVKPHEYFMAHMARGSFLEIFVLLFMETFVGISYGLLLTLLLPNVISLMGSLFGLYLPIAFISGIVWPVEAIPSYFRFVSYLSPITLPLMSIKNIMVRGWDYTRPEH